jgi:hypothetical protein
VKWDRRRLRSDSVTIVADLAAMSIAECRVITNAGRARLWMRVIHDYHARETKYSIRRLGMSRRFRVINDSGWWFVVRTS